MDKENRRRQLEDQKSAIESELRHHLVNLKEILAAIGDINDRTQQDQIAELIEDWERNKWDQLADVSRMLGSLEVVEFTVSRKEK